MSTLTAQPGAGDEFPREMYEALQSDSFEIEHRFLNMFHLYDVVVENGSQRLQETGRMVGSYAMARPDMPRDEL